MQSEGKRPERPAHVLGKAIRVAQIAISDTEYEAEPEKNAAAAELICEGG